MLINLCLFSRYFFLLHVLIIFLHNASIAQQIKDSPSVFANINAGFGMNYGGLGGNLEAGIKHFSAYGAAGYAPQSADGPILINSSVNYHFGIRYYFDVKSEQFFPRFGVGFGWITNYYDTRIGMSKYIQSVQGASVEPGVQFYSSEGFVFSFDLAISGAALILNPDTHPYFYKFYLRPCIGIGYDITRVLQLKRKTKKIKNDEINPLE